MEPVPPGAARVVALGGDVSVLKGSYPWILTVGDTIQMQQVVVTGDDGFAEFELADGSTFQIFPNSRVTFRNNPGEWKDMLDLWLGRVKIYIQKLGGQPNRNRVFTPTAVISVRGTIFDVIIEDEDDTTLVSVDEGLVDVRHRLIGETRSRLVGEGEFIRVYKNEPLASRAVDRNALLERILRASADAAYTVLVQRRTSVPGASGGGTTTGGGPSLPGDTGSGDDGAPVPPAPDSGGNTAPTPTAPTAPPTPPPPPGG